MKKIIAAFLFISLSFTAYSQSDPGFQLGLTAAPNLGWIKPDVEGMESDGSSFGFNYGILGDFNIADNYSISTGVSIANIGGSVAFPSVVTIETNNGTDLLLGRSTADIRLKYIEVPLTIKLKTNEIGYMTYFGQFGFGAGINYDATADIESSYSTGNTSSTVSEDDVDFSDEINTIRASLIVGLGAEYNLSGNTSLLFGVTFNNGFTNIFDFDVSEGDGNGNASISGETKEAKAINNYLVLNFGILF